MYDHGITASRNFLHLFDVHPFGHNILYHLVLAVVLELLDRKTSLTGNLAKKVLLLDISILHLLPTLSSSSNAYKSSQGYLLHLFIKGLVKFIRNRSPYFLL